MRISLAHRLLSTVAADLTGQDVTGILGACASGEGVLHEVMVWTDGAPQTDRSLFVLRMQEEGQALGILHGQLEVVICQNRPLTAGTHDHICRAIAAFRSLVERTGAPPRLMLRISRSFTPAWSEEMAWWTDGDWWEIKLHPPMRWRTSETGGPPAKLMPEILHG